MIGDTDGHNGSGHELKVAHLTTVDLSLAFLVKPQLLAVVKAGGEAIGISAPGPWVESLEASGVRHIPLQASTRGMNPLKDLKAARQLWRVLRTERPVILHTHNPKPGLYGRILGRLAGVPLVVNTMHGLYATPDESWFKRGIVYGLEAIASRFSDIELYQNPEDLDFVRRTHILPRRGGRLLGNGVDLTRFDPTRRDSSVGANVRRQLGVEPNQILVGTVGRLVVEKGYLDLFEAATRLGPDYRIVVVGPEDPEKSDALPRAAIADAEAQNVTFLGMRTDMDDLYAAMDIFVLPSHREGFPRAAMEAASMALPVIATDIRGCRQVVDQGSNGLLVPLRDPIALADAIRTLGENVSMRHQMGAASRRIAMERFDENQVVTRVMDAYADGLMTKGLGYLMPAKDTLATSAPPVRVAGADDVRALAQLHSTQIVGGFLPSLGIRFMRVLYRALVEWPGSVVLVVEGERGPVAFISGVVDVAQFYKYFVRRYAVRAFVSVVPRIFMPSTIRRAMESLSYGSGDDAVQAELLSLAVGPSVRRRGLASVLGQRFLESITAMGVDSVRVVVAADNSAAINAYRKLGFAKTSTLQVHAGEQSEVLLWQR